VPTPYEQKESKTKLVAAEEHAYRVQTSLEGNLRTGKLQIYAKNESHLPLGGIGVLLKDESPPEGRKCDFPKTVSNFQLADMQPGPPSEPETGKRRSRLRNLSTIILQDFVPAVSSPVSPSLYFTDLPEEPRVGLRCNPTKNGSRILEAMLPSQRPLPRLGRPPIQKPCNPERNTSQFRFTDEPTSAPPASRRLQYRKNQSVILNDPALPDRPSTKLIKRASQKNKSQIELTDESPADAPRVRRASVTNLSETMQAILGRPASGPEPAKPSRRLNPARNASQIGSEEVKMKTRGRRFSPKTLPEAERKTGLRRSPDFPERNAECKTCRDYAAVEACQK